MKRMDGDVVGRPKIRGLRRDVAGIPLPRRQEDVASFRHALDDPMGTDRGMVELMADFDEFMTGGDETLGAEGEGERAVPDPVFRERLRRRLWRTQLMTHLHDRGEIH